jgi:CRISPR-associated protein Csh2
MSDQSTLTSRREFVFLYDIKMGNPNGDPDENRPRVLPDKTHYVTDVRLKRFVRDYLKSQDQKILVDTIEGKTTNLTGRVAEFLVQKSLVQKGNIKIESGEEIVNTLLDSFIDARLFGSTFAFKTEKAKGKEEGESLLGADQTVASALEGEETQDKDDEEESSEEPEGGEPEEQKGRKKPKRKGVVSAKVIAGGQVRKVEWPQPKTLTGAVQIAHGEVKHKAQEVDINGTSIFGSDETKGRGTFTTYYALRYALVAFNGVANQYSARSSRMTDADYSTLLKAMWYGVRSAGNTRTKRGQVPRLLISVVYKPKEEFQFGNLCDYVKLTPVNGKKPEEWSSPDDYTIDLTKLAERLRGQATRIERVDFCASPDVNLSPELAAFGLSGGKVKDLELDKPPAE